jgi:hypothetical protein
MARMGKLLIIFIVMVLLSSILLIVKSSDAQSTFKPSAPKFSIRFPNDKTIQLLIENQAFTSSSSVNSIIYYYRVKDPNSERCSIDADYTLQSNSKTTIISIPSDSNDPLFSLMVNRTIPSNSKLIDFQVQAVTGYYAVTQKPGPIPGGPLNFTSPDGYTEITFNESAASDWSNPITVDLSKMAIVTIGATPTPTVPEFPALATLLFLLITGTGTAVFLKRKQTEL